MNNSPLKKIAPGTYLLAQEGAMQVPGLIIAAESLLQEGDLQEALQQVRNVASLPGIVHYSIAMPDIHWGYGFPIGGVAAMDAESGVISPGGVGYDINCGVRLATAPIAFQELTKNAKEQLLSSLFARIPSGVGRGQKGKGLLSEKEYETLLTKGARWSVEQGFGYARDLEQMESYGVIAGADPSAVSPFAKKRGRDQLGTIGSGNHFVEIGEIEELFQHDIARTWKIKEGQLYILIHSGSRGMGHQVCQDTLDLFTQKGFAEGLPDRQLVSAPIRSQEGKHYFQAMAAAANFAFNNRQHILHQTRAALQETLGLAAESIELLYDVCHNIAKFETHWVNGSPKQLCIHRKGATRAFGPGHEELAPQFQKTGQPVIVPGDMGRASYLLAGAGNPLTWCSCCHGAGRAKSRIASMKSWKGRDPAAYMHKQQVLFRAHSEKTILEEMPDAYKDVSAVVAAVEEASLATRVARLKPHLVLKG